MNIPFKGGSRLGRPLHGWQSSYATDCRSVDPGANPGPCSNNLLILELLFFFDCEDGFQRVPIPNDIHNEY